ncbi:MAG: FHA domain-containing protein [Blastococcus sp.]
MSGPATHGWPRVQVHPGTGVVDRCGDTLVVVPVLPASHPERVRELLELCRRPDPTGQARVDALRALLVLRPSAEMPGFALLIRTGHELRVLVHGPVRVVVDGRATAPPAAGHGERLATHVVEDGGWHGLTVVADGDAEGGDVADVVPLDLASGAVPGAGVTLHAVAAATGPASSATALRPAVQFRSVLLGESAARASGGRSTRVPGRPPLPVAGATGEGAARAGTAGAEVLVDGVHCPAGHVTDPDLPTCLTCGTPLPADGQPTSLPRPPLGILVTDGGTIYPVTGDLVIGREPEQAPDVLAGRARPLPLRDAARSTSRVHARLTVRGWKVLLSDNHSANGTFVSGHGAAGPWLPVTETPIPLAHGDRVRLGRRQLLFDTWREAVVPQVVR